jgi:anti-sigma B factor antagonist
MPLTLSSHHSGSVCIVHCAGKIVYGEEESALEAALEHAQHGFSRLVLDLSGVTRLDSMGLGLLVRHYTRVARRGGAIHLAGAPGFVTNLLDLTRLSTIIPNFGTEDEAILSFQNRGWAARSDARRGPRLLVFDPSADLCIFARSVLSQHGFDVRTTCAFGDAKLLLRADQVDFVLVGPGTAQLSAEVAARDLSAVAPRASVLQLGSDFMSHDATTATQILLKVCGISGASQMAS